MFFDDSTSLMNTFALTQDEKMAIINSMDSGTATTDDAKTIGELLAQELEENFTGYYKEIW